jgi:[ribosomal protein S18]-alanine N-acetyltransferase
MSTLAPPVIAMADERHLDALMTVMTASFDSAFGEAWSALQLAGTLGLASSFARQAVDGRGRTIGFTLCRAAGPEVELLLIAVHPEARGHGLGRLLIGRAIDDARQRGASELFLEVRDNNLAARSLYQNSGFSAVGHRPEYYIGVSGEKFGAITMRRMLTDLD